MPLDSTVLRTGDYAGCFSMAAASVDRVNGWEAGLYDGLGYIHELL